MRSEAFGRIIERFRSHLARRNYMRSTIDGRMDGLRIFREFLERKGLRRIGQVASQHVLEFWVYLKGRKSRRSGEPLRPLSVQAYLITLRIFFGFLKNQDLILTDPTAVLPKLRRESPLPKNVMTREEARLILKQPDLTTAQGLRDRALMEVVYSTGIRAGELARLTVYDIDFEEGFLRVNQGKGNRDRVVPIGKVACRYVQRYQEEARGKLGGGILDLLFLGLNGKPLSVGRVGGIVRRYVRALGIERPLSTHSFRKACATEMLRGGADIRYVQEMMGHTSLQTTKVYTRVYPVDLKRSHARAHPRERGAVGEAAPFRGDGRLFWSPGKRKAIVVEGGAPSVGSCRTRG